MGSWRNLTKLDFVQGNFQDAVQCAQAGARERRNAAKCFVHSFEGFPKQRFSTHPPSQAVQLMFVLPAK